MRNPLVFAVVLMSSLLCGCSWLSNIRDSKVVACGEQVLSERFPELVPAVKVCLAATDQASGVQCLLGLVKPAAGVTVDLIACLTREEALAATKKAGAGVKVPGPILPQAIADGFFAHERITFSN